MSVIDDIRKVIQDLVEPDLKAIKEKIAHIDDTSKLRDHSLAAKIDGKFEALNAKIDANHQSILYTLNIEKRLEVVERKTM